MIRVHWTIVRRAIFLLFLCGYLFGRIRDNHDGIIKESPVDLSSLRQRTNLALWLPHEPVRHFNGTHIDDRYRKLNMRSLNSGQQGSVQTYTDTAAEMNISVVIKTLSGPSRNEIPSTLLPAFRNFTERWPSEIEAGLALGPRTSKGEYAFVPVHDYFILQDLTSPAQEWSWAIVTELVAGGTLANLADRVRSETPRSADQVDMIYRTAFNRLLANLRWLHNDGYCHDDVKPANIYIRSPQQWLLGDLGNTRDAEHAWHSTRLWRRNNKESVPTCTENDMRRALKAYMIFLRSASRDQAQFDWEFRTGTTPWSKLYWDAMDSSLSADDTIAISTENSPSTSQRDISSYRASAVFDRVRKLRVDEEMKWNSNFFKLWILP